jgi:hypothetical protein
VWLPVPVWLYAFAPPFPLPRCSRPTQIHRAACVSPDDINPAALVSACHALMAPARSEGVRAAAALALRALARSTNGRREFARRPRLVDSLVSMLACGVYTTEALYAAVVLANAVIDSGVKKQFLRPELSAVDVMIGARGVSLCH